MSEFSIMNFLTDWIGREKLGDDKPPSFWPSSAGAENKNGEFFGTCRRRIFLQYLIALVNYSEKSNNKYSFWKDLITIVKSKYIRESNYQRWIWEQGNLFEDHIVNLIKESGLFVASQTQVYIPEYNVSGKIDIISFNPENQKYIITEVKSVYGPNGEKTIGTDYERHNKIPSEPRDYNLMQIALYQWHYAVDDKFDYGQLIYGDRGNGKYSVYQVDVKKDTGAILYRTIDPFVSKWTQVPYTIFDILNLYKEIQDDIDAGIIPEKDFQLNYDDDTFFKLVDDNYKIVTLNSENKKVKEYTSLQEFIDDGKEEAKSRKFKLDYKNKFVISKTESEQFVKYLDRKTNGGKEVKRPTIGNYQCSYCSFKDYCYPS